MAKIGLERLESDPFLTRYGLTCDEAYDVALAVHRKEKDYLELSYEDKNNISAFYRQATHGSYQPEKAPVSGWLDFVGHDRRKAWERLGNLSASAAKAGLCQMMLTASSKSFEAAMMKSKREKFTRIERERVALREADRKKREDDEAQRNGQSNVTLLSHHEGELQRQREQQAIVYQQQQNVLEKQHETLSVTLGATAPSTAKPMPRSVSAPAANGMQSSAQASCNDATDGTNGTAVNGTVAPRGDRQAPAAASTPPATAAIWTRPGVKEFIESTECKTVCVPRSDTLCVRVPVETLGNSVFWQFATSDFDISFAVDFHKGEIPPEDSPIVDLDSRTELLTPHRLNSHQEVVCGSHKPTETGYYVLRFDNTYSYLRAKTVHFHIYCAP